MPSERVVWLPKKEWATARHCEILESIWQAPHFKLVYEALESIALQPLLVGGVVRDLLLDRANNDVDLIVNCAPRKLMKMGSKLSKLTSATPVPLDKERGTLRLCFSPELEVDLVALQGETLLEDLNNRDLTINAMAIDPRGRLADPTGGLTDLQKGKIRDIRADNFTEDPLRVIRALRFSAQLNFAIDDSTLRHANEAVDGLERVAGERINSELGKFFDHARSQQVHLLREIGVAEALLFLPSYGWQQLTEAVSKAPVGLALGLALWFGPCLKTQHSDPLFSRLKLSRKLQRFLTSFWRGARKVRASKEMPLGEIFELSKATGEAFQALARALQLQTFPTKLSSHSRERIRVEASGEGSLRWDPTPWNGDELKAAMGKEPGPWLGKAIRVLETQWAVGEVQNLEQGVRYLEDRST